MLRFIESIRFENDTMPLLQLHQKRIEATQMAAWGKVLHPPLEEIVFSQTGKYSFETNIKYKCRLLYDESTASVTFQQYEQAVINKLSVKIDDTIDYSYKYEDRRHIDKLKSTSKTGTDIIIVKNNLLTDSSYANIALFDGVRWFTPRQPLLNGVQRQYLLNNKIIYTKDISMADLRNFGKIKLFNALVNWEEAWQLNIADILL